MTSKIIYQILKILPWLLLVGALAWYYTFHGMPAYIPGTTESRNSLIVKKIESLGKLELVKYNFQEVTELKKISGEIDFKLFKLKSGPDSKAVLISTGEAVGCVDLATINEKDVSLKDDTVFIRLPTPEICYFKIDLQKSRIYDLKEGYLSSQEKNDFISNLYKKAENEIMITARNSGILEQTKVNAELILKPFLEEVSDRAFVFTYDLPADSVSLESEMGDIPVE